MNAASYVISAAPQPTLPVVGEAGTYPVRRIWCVGRNYLEHIREMGNDERAPPFFFAKHADMLVPDGATIPYPPLTKDLHHEVELIVAMKSGGLNIPPTRRSTMSTAMRRHRPHPPRPADRVAQEGAARGKSASRSTIPRPAPRCSRPRRSATPRKARSGSRSTARNPEGRPHRTDLERAGNHLAALAAGRARRRRHHHDGHPAGVSQLKPGDKIECGVDGVGTLKVAIGNPE
jgi:fumarylpyruvate hydrolase